MEIKRVMEKVKTNKTSVKATTMMKEEEGGGGLIDQIKSMFKQVGFECSYGSSGGENVRGGGGVRCLAIEMGEM